MAFWNRQKKTIEKNMTEEEQKEYINSSVLNSYSTNITNTYIPQNNTRKTSKDYKNDIETTDVTIRYGQHISRAENRSLNTFLLDAIRIEDFEINGLVNTGNDSFKTLISSGGGQIRSKKSNDIRIEDDGAYWTSGKQNQITEEELNLIRSFNNFLDKNGFFDILKKPAFDLSISDASNIKKIMNEFISEDLIPYINTNFNEKIERIEKETEINASHQSTIKEGALNFNTFLEESSEKAEIQKMFFDVKVKLEIANLDASINSYERMSNSGAFDSRNIDKNDLAIYAVNAYIKGPQYWDKDINNYICNLIGNDNPKTALLSYIAAYTDMDPRYDYVDMDTFFSSKNSLSKALQEHNETARQHNESQVKDLEIRKTYFEKIQEISRTPETINGVEYPSKLDIVAQSYDPEALMSILSNPSSKNFDILTKTMYRLEKSTEELSLNKEYKEYQGLVERTTKLQEKQESIKQNKNATKEDYQKLLDEEKKLEEDKLKLADKLGISLDNNKVTLEQIEKNIQEKDNGAQIKQNAAAYLILSDIIDVHPYNPAILASRDASRQLHDISNSSLLTFQESRNFNTLGVSKEYDTVGKCFEAVYGDKNKEQDLERELKKATEKLVVRGINLGIDPSQLSKLAIEGKFDEVITELKKVDSGLKISFDKLEEINAQIEEEKQLIKNKHIEELSSAKKELQITEKTLADYISQTLPTELKLEKIQELSTSINEAKEKVEEISKENRLEASSDKIRDLENQKEQIEQIIRDTPTLDSSDNEKIINDYKTAVTNMAAYREAQNVVENHKVIFSIEDESTYEKNYPSQETINKLKQCGLIYTDGVSNGTILSTSEKQEDLRKQALRLSNPQEVAKRIIELQEDSQKKNEELEKLRQDINNPNLKGKAELSKQIKQLETDLNKNSSQLAVLEPAFEKYMDMHNLSAGIADGKIITPEQKLANEIVNEAQNKMEQINIRNESILKNGELIFNKEELETLKNAFIAESTRYSMDKEQLVKLSKIPGIENLTHEEASRVLSVYASNEKDVSHKIPDAKLRIIEESIEDKDSGRLDLALALATNHSISDNAAKEIDRNFNSLNEEYKKLLEKQENILQMEDKLEQSEKKSQEDIDKLEKLKTEFEKEKQELAENLEINTSSKEPVEKITLEKINDALQERTSLIIYTAEHETQSKFFERMAEGEISISELTNNKKYLENNNDTKNQFNQFRNELIIAGTKNPEVHNTQLSEEELKAFRERISQITDEAIDINATGIEYAVRNNFNRQIMQAYAYGNAYENPAEVSALKDLRKTATETMQGYQKNRANVTMNDKIHDEIHKKYEELHNILNESQINSNLHDKIMLSTLNSGIETREELSYILSSTKLSDGTSLGEKISEVKALRNTVISSTEFDKQAVEEIKSFAQTDVVKNGIIVVENQMLSDAGKQEIDKIIRDSFYDTSITSNMQKNMNDLVNLHNEVKTLQAMRERYVEIDEGLKAFANNSEITNGALALTESSYARRIDMIDNRLKEIQEQCETISQKFSPLNISKEEANAFAETQAQAAIISDRLSDETGRVSSNIINQNMEPINTRRIQVETQSDTYHSLVKMMQLEGFNTQKLDDLTQYLKREQIANGTDDRYKAFIEALSQRSKIAEISTNVSIDEAIQSSNQVENKYRKEIISEIKLILTENSPTFTTDFSQTQSFLKNPTENNDAKFDLFVDGIKDKEIFIRELASAGIFDRGFSNEIKTRDDMLNACSSVNFSEESQLRKIYDSLNSGNAKIDVKDNLQKESIEAAVEYNKLVIAMNEGRVEHNPSINSIAELPDAVEMIPMSSRVLKFTVENNILEENEANKFASIIEQQEGKNQDIIIEASPEDTEIYSQEL